MKPDRAETLIDGYLQGTLTEAEQAELDRALAEDPGVARLLMGAVADESLFRELLGGADRLRRLERPAPARRPAIRWAALAAGAMIAITLGVLFFLRGAPGVATIVRVEGTVHILGHGPAAVGAEVPRGSGIESGAASSVTLQFPDATRMDLGGNARLSRVDPDRLRLERGSIAIDAKRPLALETPHGEARVLGTRFRVSVADDSTRLDVNEGKVRLMRLDGKSVDVISGHYAVAAAGVELAAKPVARRGAELVAKMPPKSWVRVPNTPLRAVVPDYSRYPKIFSTGLRAIIEGWSGGALDTRRSRLIVWGGGSTLYNGNELYAFDVNSLSWARLTEPWPDPPDGAQANPDGSPTARATYNGLAYIGHADRLFSCGGETARSDRTKGSLADLTWTFDLESKRWSDRKPSGDLPPTYVGNSCSYDPETRKVWWGETNSVGRPGLYSYDYDANRWTRHSTDGFYSQTSAVDTRRGLLVTVGRGEIFAYDLRRGDFTRQIWKTTGGDEFVAGSAPGFDYDPVADRIVGWGGGAVYALDPDTKAWTVHPAPGAPAATPTGIFGRWRYVPSVKAFVVATDVDGDVHFFKFAP